MADEPDQNQLPPDPMNVFDGLAAVHHEWFEAWQRSGFTEAQAFELVKTAVHAGFRSS